MLSTGFVIMVWGWCYNLMFALFSQKEPWLTLHSKKNHPKQKVSAYEGTIETWIRSKKCGIRQPKS